MPETPLVYILLLNYRGAKDTLTCLDSLQALAYPHRQIWVIDNASPDDSIAVLKQRLEQFPGEFTLIESPENLGFSGGNNLGIQRALEAHSERETVYIWLLNNDTTVQADTLSHLVAAAERTGGLVGSLLKYPDGSYQQAGTRINWLTGKPTGYPEDQLKDGMPLETLSGASMLIPLDVFRQLGLMAEEYFLYFEDGELSLRAARTGYPLTLAMKSIVYHIESASTGKHSLSTQYYYQRNRLALLKQYATPSQWMSIGWYSMFRLLRSVVKYGLKPSFDRKASLKVQWLAMYDFCQGVTGKCPHHLENQLKP